MRKLQLVVTSLILILYFSACHQKDEINSPNNDDFNSAQFALIDYLDVQAGVEDATLDTDMKLNDPLFSTNFMEMKGDFGPGNKLLIGNPWFDRFDFGKHLGLLFRRLKLSDTQKEQAKDLMKTYRESVKGSLKEFRDANVDIIKAANEARKAIADQVKAGTLTREDAKVQIQKLNEDTRAKINANPASVAIKAKMCAARTALFTGVESILDTAQKAAWGIVVSKLADPCK